MRRLSPQIPTAVRASYPIRMGNSVRPLIDGEAAFRRICEAIEAAQLSVWLTVAFIAPEFQMPDGRGSLFDVLDRAAERGLDVRALFWRPNPELAQYERRHAPEEPMCPTEDRDSWRRGIVAWLAQRQASHCSARRATAQLISGQMVRSGRKTLQSVPAPSSPSRSGVGEPFVAPIFDPTPGHLPGRMELS